MKTNMGNLDRLMRLTIAVGIFFAYRAGYINGVWAIVLGIVAAAFILTSMIGTCPMYLPFGLSTMAKKINGKRV